MENRNSSLDELKKRFGDTAFKNKDRTIERALELAYADMSRRAQGHTKDSKDKSIKYLQCAFQEVKNGNRIINFDEWHRGICDGLKGTIQSGSFDGTYGRAQKVLNMAFKYLMYTDYAEYIPIDDCHMTLDSYTLAWFKREVKRVKSAGIKFSDAFTWSKIDKYEDYIAIQEDIRNHLASDNNRKYSIDIEGLNKTEPVDLPPQPILAEFIIWEGEKLSEKYKNLVSGINAYKKDGKKDDSWLIGESFSDFLRNM